jgi:signal recognition particle subunit SEC65
MELAANAGAGHTEQSETNQLIYIKFAHLIAGALNDLDTTIDKIDLSRIIELAEEAGYKPIEIDWTNGSAPLDVNAMLVNSQKEVFFTRYAYRIAAELGYGQPA